MERITSFTDSEFPNGNIQMRAEQIASLKSLPLLFDPAVPAQSQPLLFDSALPADSVPRLFDSAVPLDSAPHLIEPAACAGPASSTPSSEHSPADAHGNVSVRLFARCCDLVIGSLLLALVLPLMAFCAVAVMLSGPGPVLYRQTRIGRDGHEFTCLKFRTMADRADLALDQLLSQSSRSQEEWRALYKLHADPRVTPIGRWLRRYSLDELPQLFNVLRGDMSVVGPRPIVDEEISRFGRHFVDYCLVKPGLTGLWQVSGRHTLTYDQRVRLDAEYANSKSLLLDLLILWRTIPIVVRGQNE